jgi:ketohexokinase
MRILGVGIATLDLVFRVDGYPAEDTEVRARDLRRVRGGNVANSLVVLSQLQHECSWAGSLVDEADTAAILSDFERYGVDVSHACWHACGQLPISCVLAGADSGSRTIVHYRDLPEFPVEAFAAIDLTAYDWVHFEGRDPLALRQMLARLRDVNGPPCSLEVEKPRPGLEACFAHVDLLMFSRHYARSCGFDSAQALLAARAVDCPATPLFCAWGDQGATALQQGRLYQRPACPAIPLVETLGAGDVFNAAVIHGMAAGHPLPRILDFACGLAGRKCTQTGFAGLGHA